jgi:hypothetical protein
VLGALYGGGYYAVGEWTGTAWTKVPATVTPGTYFGVDGTTTTEIAVTAVRTDEHGHAVVESAAGATIAMSAAPWNARPHAARTVNTWPDERALDGPGFDVYRSEAKRIMTARGATGDAPHLDSVTRVDLDGDGAEEVLVVASSRTIEPGESGPLPDLTNGSYVVLYVRHVVGNGARSDVVWAQVAGGDKKVLPNIGVVAIADFNGDGTMEVTGSRNYFEDPIYFVWDAGSATREPSTIFSPDDF